MMKFRENGNENGNGPSHNTGLTSLHQITTCVIKLRFSRYPGLKGIITIIDPCIQMLCTVDSIEELQDSWISIFLDVILILIYIKLECRCLM